MVAILLSPVVGRASSKSLRESFILRPGGSHRAGADHSRVNAGVPIGSTAISVLPRAPRYGVMLASVLVITTGRSKDVQEQVLPLVNDTTRDS